MKKIILLTAWIFCSITSIAQKYATEKSTITFFSKAAIEDIAATNSKAVSIFNVTTGEIVYAIPMKDFEFEKSLMKDHFNEKYIESEKFPKATFQGKITGYKEGIKGEQVANAKGKLTIHGVTNEIDTVGMVNISDGKIFMKSTFIVKLKDYNIKIPQLLWKNIAEHVEVKIEFTYKPL